MLLSFAEIRLQYFSFSPSNDELGFYRVFLFLSGVVSFLLFFGLSMADSLASTTIHSISGVS